MSFYIHIIISLCLAITLYVCYERNETRKVSFSDSVLVIGILSARENFELREAARSTWLKDFCSYKKNIVKSWFIIGKNGCNIPPIYRLSKYGCEKWNINKSGLSDHFYTSHEIFSEECPPSFKKVFRQGFSFKVNHPVIVKRLGILFNLLMPNVKTRVAILDIQNKEIVVQTSITRNTSSLMRGYLYEDVETVLLPKNYEGMVLVEGYLQHETCADVLWNDGAGVITFNRIYSTPSHIDSMEFTSKVFSAASIEFLVHDIKSLENILMKEEAVTSEWIKNNEILNEKLLTESEEKKDILFVDVTDTYRNLPIKLLHFYKWIDQHYEYSYAVKSDDDTVIDISGLIQSINRNTTFNKDEHWIWSWFRKDWPVNYIGKWADYDYTSSVYPAFPCGAMYVMSHKTVKWLSTNAKYLFPYQGEDVSMGIWLSAIKPNFIDDEHFECDSTCNERSYNRAQLTAEQIHEVWSLYKMCQNLCLCD